MSARRLATFNALHLGDNLLHLHFLRKLAQTYPEIHFTHGAPAQHLGQLAPLVVDLPNLTLADIAETGQGAINAWRGAGGWFYQQPDQHDFVKIHLRWFAHLAQVMGLESPIQQASDLLFDYPELKSNGFIKLPCKTVLVINSAPHSGQFQGFDPAAFDALVASLMASFYAVITTAPNRHGATCTSDLGGSVTHIGRISQTVDLIIGVATGPLWTTFNVWNRHVPRVILLDHERVDILPGVTAHTNSIGLVPEILRDRGLL